MQRGRVALARIAEPDDQAHRSRSSRYSARLSAAPACPPAAAPAAGAAAAPSAAAASPSTGAPSTASGAAISSIRGTTTCTTAASRSVLHPAVGAAQLAHVDRRRRSPRPLTSTSIDSGICERQHADLERRGAAARARRRHARPLGLPMKCSGTRDRIGGAVDHREVAVDQAAAHRIALDVLEQHDLALDLLVALEVEQRVRALVHHLVERQAIDGDRRPAGRRGRTARAGTRPVARSLRAAPFPAPRAGPRSARFSASRSPPRALLHEQRADGFFVVDAPDRLARAGRDGGDHDLLASARRCRSGIVSVTIMRSRLDSSMRLTAGPGEHRVRDRAPARGARRPCAARPRSA